MPIARMHWRIAAMKKKLEMRVMAGCRLSLEQPYPRPTAAASER